MGAAPGADIAPEQASRFLAQAAFGATDALIAEVQRLGYEGWLDAQLALPRSEGHVAWMRERGFLHERHRNTFQGVDNSLWRKLFTAPDVLRQRMALALSEIFVVSMQGLGGVWRGPLAAHYMDLLEQQAFGTYRELLEAVTLSPAMGQYLNLRGNQKGDPATGRMPDENYAREVLQLFSIGLVELQPDGTPRGRVPQDTYTQHTVSELARVFTGWVFDGFSRDDPAWTQRPLRFVPARHDAQAKQVLGLNLPAGTPGPVALRRVLDAMAGHANVGPFIGRQLIQRLVSSNPSPAYVRRVATVFNDNGRGVRGDLGAVLKAVLLDEEARRDPGPNDSARGLLREPVLRFVQWGRTFGAQSGSGEWAIGSTLNPANRLGQSPLRAPSVFNFFRPGYRPPGLAGAGPGGSDLVAPEFQLAHETSVAGWINFAQQFATSGVADVKPDYSAELALASRPEALVARLNILLAAGQLQPATCSLIAQAVQTLPAATPVARHQRVAAALLLVLASPDYLVTV